MAIIKMYNKDSDLESLSDDAKVQLGCIQFADSELARLQAKAVALKTIRFSYSKALQAALPAIGGSDTIKR